MAGNRQRTKITPDSRETQTGTLTVTFLHRCSIRHPRRILLAAACVVAALVPGVTQLKLRTDGHALVPEGNTQVIYDRSVREEFGTEDLIVVLIESDHADGIFNVGTLGLIQDLTRDFQAMDEIPRHFVSSLGTEHSHRVKSGTLDFRRFLEPLPQTPQQLTTLRSDLDKIQLHTGTVVGKDGHAASVFIGIPAESDRAELHREVREIIAEHGPRDERIDVIGAVVAEALLGTHILEDLGVPRPLLGLGPDIGESDASVHWPNSLHELRVMIGRRVGLVPIAILIMAMVFALCFRSVTAAALPLIEVGACLVSVFGLMGYLGVPVYLTIAVMPIILTAMGVADEIHVFSRYRRELQGRPGQSHIIALSAAMDDMWLPVAKTSMTTAVAFLSFTLSPLGPVRAFGVFTAIGIVFCMIWSLTVVPAMLVLINPDRFHRGNRSVVPNTANFFLGLTAFVRRFRYAIIAVAVAVMAIAPFGLSRVIVQDSWIDGFAPSSAFAKAMNRFNDQFLGMHVLLVRVDTEHRRIEGELEPAALDHHSIKVPAKLLDDPDGCVGHWIIVRRANESDATDTARPRRATVWKSRIEGLQRDGDAYIVTFDRRRGSPLISLRPGDVERVRFEIPIEPLTEPPVLRRIEALQSFIADQREFTVGGVIGTTSYLSTANYMARGLREDARSVPDNADRVEWVWGQYKRIRGEERMHQVVDVDFASSLVTVFLKNANFLDVEKLLATIRAYEKEHLSPHGVTLGFAGDVAVSQTMIDAIVDTQVRSLLVSLVGILLVTAVMGQSLGWGIFCVLPCAIAVMVNFAVMGWTRMPLGVATSMFAGMTLGIGVDYAIHMLESYRVARRRGQVADEAISDAIGSTGPAICIDALAVALGFGILTLSQVPANARLGALLALSIVGCLLATLLVLPALLFVFTRRSARSSE